MMVIFASILEMKLKEQIIFYICLIDKIFKSLIKSGKTWYLEMGIHMHCW